MLSKYRVFFLGVIAGIVLASVGMHGILRIIDKGVEYIRTNSFELSK